MTAIRQIKDGKYRMQSSLFYPAKTLKIIYEVLYNNKYCIEEIWQQKNGESLKMNIGKKTRANHLK